MSEGIRRPIRLLAGISGYKNLYQSKTSTEFRMSNVTSHCKTCRTETPCKRLLAGRGPKGKRYISSHCANCGSKKAPLFVHQRGRGLWDSLVNAGRTVYNAVTPTLKKINSVVAPVAGAVLDRYIPGSGAVGQKAN